MWCYKNLVQTVDMPKNLHARIENYLFPYSIRLCDSTQKRKKKSSLENQSWWKKKLCFAALHVSHLLFTGKEKLWKFMRHHRRPRWEKFKHKTENVYREKQWVKKNYDNDTIKNLNDKVDFCLRKSLGKKRKLLEIKKKNGMVGREEQKKTSWKF